MIGRLELVAGGVRVEISGCIDHGILADEATRLHDAARSRRRHAPHDELARSMVAVAEALTIYLYGPAAREALAAGVGVPDILAHYAATEAAAEEERGEALLASIPVHGTGRPPLRESWRATDEQDRALVELLAAVQPEGPEDEEAEE